MRKPLLILFFTAVVTVASSIFKRVSDMLVEWAIGRYNEPTPIYLTIVEFRFLELALSSILICYAFILYLYIFHRKLFMNREVGVDLTIDFIIPILLFIPLFLINQAVVLTTINRLSIPFYVRTLNTVYSLIVVFIYLSYTTVKYVYRMDWRMLGRVIRYSMKYLEYIIIYVVIGYVVYAFLVIIIVNPVFMTIARVLNVVERGVYSALLITPAVFLESLILYIYFLIFIEPFINEVKLDVVMKRYA